MAIRLRDDGYGDHVIAVALAVDDDQVPMLLQLADSKLTTLMALDVDTDRNGRIDRPQAPPAYHSIEKGES